MKLQLSVILISLYHISLINFINSYNIQCLIQEFVIGFSLEVLITPLDRNGHVLGICFYHCNELNFCPHTFKCVTEVLNPHILNLE